MENKIDEMIEHLSYSQQQIARIFEAQRHTSVHMSQVIHSLPMDQVESKDDLVSPGGQRGPDKMKSAGGHVGQVNGSISSYLNAMADLQEIIADSLEAAMKEMRVNDQGEE
ncbi:hypothetical protein [Paenibacillus dakarensis]|uniref:hypothetical protein n=1 Tax=Paenibacillus dakarensis TaxID=1527293 RepID=UPI0006D5993A|nr:hypothetical protein [Paenibacillus dakarensis]